MEGIDITDQRVGAVVFGIYFVAIPAIVGIINVLCRWIDSNEKTFKYPVIWEITCYRFLDGIGGTHFFVVVGAFLSMILGWAWRFSFNNPVFPIVVGILVAILLITKKLFTLVKNFARHCKDQNAHKGD